MKQDQFGLPRELGDGLLLRWATPEDAEELARFNVRIHSDDPDEPEEDLGYWTKDLMNGRHPTTGAEDFTVVVDTENEDKIVSSLNLISQTWTYDGIPFPVGRPELVGTDPDYRRRGLVRLQMEVIHAKSAAREEMVQAITGIPWYYRMFGYEMALNLGGGRDFFWTRQGNEKVVAQQKEDMYQLRPGTVEDIPALTDLYEANNRGSLLTRVRDEALWRYELSEPHPESGYARHIHMIETKEAEVVGYVEYRRWGNRYSVRELGVKMGHPWRPVCLFLIRALKQRADAYNETAEKPVQYLHFHLGAAHPAYEALGDQLEKQRPPYAWYMRAPDLPRFLRHIAPALEKRLADSVMAGYTGTLRLNFYRSTMTLVFENDRLQNIGTFTPKRMEEGDAHFPDLTFLQLLFGYRSLAELKRARADCRSENEAAIVLNILFPKRPSNVIGLG